MKIFYTLLFISFFLSFNSKAQTDAFLSNEEKAYMYHIVMKSPTLKRNMVYIFNYSGTFSEKKTDDYLFIEKEILKEPHLLAIDLAEFKNLSSGVVGQLSVKMALWTLYNELKIGIKTKNEEDYPVIYQDFIDSLIILVPKSVLIIKQKQPSLSKVVLPLLNPNLTFNERKGLASKIGGLDINEEKKMLDAIHSNIKTYTEKKSKQVYKMLGMHDDLKANFLIAAGDGSGTAGLLGEKETDNVDDEGKPKGVGLFTYQTNVVTNGRKQELQASKEPKATVHSIGANKQTNLHLSAWGFNYSVQTSVVVTKNNKSYLLYGSKYTGELSPDASFNNDEKTYASHIKQLKEIDIPEWEETVFGDHGLENKLKQLKEEKKELLVNIHKNEYKESMWRLDQKKNHKKIKRIGDELNRQHSQLSKLNKEIEEADEEFYLAKIKLDEIKFHLQNMLKNLGDYQQDFTRKSHLEYEFEDGTIFNVKSQDLIFSSDSTPQEIEVTLLAVGTNAMSSYADEVQLNVSVTEVNANKIEVENVALYLNDAFKPDKYALNDLVFSKEADYLLNKIVVHIIEQDIPLELNLKGEGIGVKKDDNIIAASNQKEATLKKYPGEILEEQATNKEKNEFKDLRITQGNINFKNKELVITIASFTDPVKSNVFTSSNTLKNFSKQHPEITGNEILSALRTFALYEKLTKKMIKISEEHLKKDKDKQAKYEKYFNQKLENTGVMINDYRLTYDLFKK
jgi:hypothetical protein